MPTRDARAQLLDTIEQRRGKPAADHLRAAILAAWKAPRPAEG